MQISRHWRMNAQRYRLEGVRYEDGHVDLEARPAPQNLNTEAQSVGQVDEITPRQQAQRASITAA